MGVIYLRTNLVNGMQYVGQTVDFKKREYSWNNLGWKYGNQLLTDDRIKYGLDNFKVKIVKECDDSELDEWETYFIKKFNSIYPNGYNDNEGGKLGFHHSQKTKDKISEKAVGRPSPFKGKTYNEIYDNKTSEKLKKILSDLAKAKTGAKNPFYGKHFKVHPMQGKHLSEASKKKIGDANRNHPKTSTPVIQEKDDGTIIEWVSMREASRNGYDCGSISRAVKGLYKNCGHHYKDSNWYIKNNDTLTTPTIVV